jgi:hypothetical protein
MNALGSIDAGKFYVPLKTLRMNTKSGHLSNKISFKRFTVYASEFNGTLNSELSESHVCGEEYIVNFKEYVPEIGDLIKLPRFGSDSKKQDLFKIQAVHSKRKHAFLTPYDTSVGVKFWWPIEGAYISQLRSLTTKIKKESAYERAPWCRLK